MRRRQTVLHPRVQHPIALLVVWNSESVTIRVRPSPTSSRVTCSTNTWPSFPSHSIVRTMRSGGVTSRQRSKPCPLPSGPRMTNRQRPPRTTSMRSMSSGMPMPHHCAIRGGLGGHRRARRGRGWRSRRAPRTRIPRSDGVVRTWLMGGLLSFVRGRLRGNRAGLRAPGGTGRGSRRRLRAGRDRGCSGARAPPCGW